MELAYTLPYQSSNLKTFTVEVQLQSTNRTVLHSVIKSFTMDWQFTVRGIITKLCFPLVLVDILENGAKQTIPLPFSSVSTCR